VLAGKFNVNEAVQRQREEEMDRREYESHKRLT
jgi:hypothetical protein